MCKEVVGDNLAKVTAQYCDNNIEKGYGYITFEKIEPLCGVEQWNNAITAFVSQTPKKISDKIDEFDWEALGRILIDEGEIEVYQDGETNEIFYSFLVG